MEGLDALGGRKRLASAQRITRLWSKARSPSWRRRRLRGRGRPVRSWPPATSSWQRARQLRLLVQTGSGSNCRIFGVSWTLPPTRTSAGTCAPHHDLAGEHCAAETAERWGLVRDPDGGAGEALSQRERLCAAPASETTRALSPRLRKGRCSPHADELEALLKAEPISQPDLSAARFRREGRRASWPAEAVHFEGR
jgi:hypothetical protein